jgi:phospholipid/cholesterol/gamma-HCH transport system substrate-binding protein
MASIRTKMAVGIFVIAGFGLAFVAIIWLGMSDFFGKGKLYVAYFDESVQGLAKDSPVKYRGVPIGRVDSVIVAPDGNLIQVVMKIESGLRADPNIVAQLKSVGITGIMFVELDRKDPGMPDKSPRLAFETDHPVIATRPSDIKQFFDSFAQILDQFKALDLPAISGKIKTSLDRFDEALSQARINEMSASLASALKRIDQIMGSDAWTQILAHADAATIGLERFTRSAAQATAKIDQTADMAKSFVDANQEKAARAVEQLTQALTHANAAMQQARQMVLRQEPGLDALLDKVGAAAQNLERASRNLDRLLEGAVQAPSQLIWGTPPAPRAIEGDPARARADEKRLLR